MALSPSAVSAVKVGGASVLGGGGLTGTGLFIHSQIQKSNSETENKVVESILSGLDKSLVDESTVYLAVSPDNSKFAVDNTNQNQVTLKIKAVSKAPSTTFSNDKWTCTIKGIVKNVNNSTINLVTEESGKNFDSEAQTKLFSEKFGEGDDKKSNKDNFVKSCAKNRNPKTPANVEGDWTSEIIVELTKTGGNGNNLYEFPTESISKIFSGMYTNPS